MPKGPGENTDALLQHDLENTDACTSLACTCTCQYSVIELVLINTYIHIHNKCALSSLHSTLQGAMEATFTAFKAGSPTAQLEPVTRSSIAKRRQNKKSSTSL